MQFSDMQTALMRYGFDSTDPLGTWLNAAMHDFEMAADWDVLESDNTIINLPANTNTISVPNDFRKVIDIRDYDNQVKLRQWNRRKFDRDIMDQSQPGLMELYTVVRNGSIQVWRVPYVNTNVQLWYQVACPDMVNPTDQPGPTTNPFPVGCHYPIVVRAAAIALMAENEEQRATTAQQEYQSMLIRCIGAYAGERTLDDVETVQDVQGYAEDMPIRGIVSW